MDAKHSEKTCYIQIIDQSIIAFQKYFNPVYGNNNIKGKNWMCEGRSLRQTLNIVKPAKQT